MLALLLLFPLFPLFPELLVFPELLEFPELLGLPEFPFDWVASVVMTTSGVGVAF